MTQHYRQFFSRNFYVWRFFGHWYPTEPRNGPSSNKIISILFNGAYSFFWIGQFLYLTEGVENLIVLTDVVTLGMIFFLASFKGVLLIYNTARMERVFRMVDKMEESTIGSKEEEAIILATLPTLRRNWLGISICGVICATTQMLKTTLNSENILMHPSYLRRPIDKIENIYLYYVCNLVQYGMAIHTSVLYGTMETIAPNLMLVLNAFLKIFNQRLTQLGRNTSNNEETMSKMRECVEFHKICIEYRKILEEMFGFTYLFQFSYQMIALCTTTYVLTMVTDPAAWFFMFSLLAAQTQQLFLPCYCGTLLYYESNLSLSSIYMSNWRDASKSFKLSLLIFGERSTKPFELHSMGGLYSISLPTFVGVIKTAYSMLSCLTQME